MGTSGAYSGAGGKAGRDIGAGAGEWLGGLSGGGDSDSDAANDPGADGKPPVDLPPRLVSGVLSLLRPGSPSGGGGVGLGGAGGGRAGRIGGSTGGTGGGGLRRSTSRMAGSAGRAAAAAYAYATEDRASLSALGLDFDDLRALRDPIEVTRRIVETACGPRSSSTLEEHEERYVAARVAEWVLEGTQDGATPTPEEITRYAIATIIAEVIASEIGEALKQWPEKVEVIADSELRDAAEVLASKAELSVTGASEAELAKAIEDGINTLREIYGVGD